MTDSTAPPAREQIHATAIALGEVGVLLRGPSGAGKSDLALRLIEAGGQLVADDRVDLALDSDAAGESVLLATPPPALAGLIEARGIGLFRCPNRANVRLRLAVDLVAPEALERLPEAARCAYLGVELPLIALAPFEASAVAKLQLAARADGMGILEP